MRALHFSVITLLLYRESRWLLIYGRLFRNNNFPELASPQLSSFDNEIGTTYAGAAVAMAHKVLCERRAFN